MRWAVAVDLIVASHASLVQFGGLRRRAKDRPEKKTGRPAEWKRCASEAVMAGGG